MVLTRPVVIVVQAAASVEVDEQLVNRELTFKIRNEMKIQDSAAKDALTSRLNRIEGQIRGVRSMVENERDCREIMQQLIAIHSAVQSASRTFFQEYSTACLLAMDDQPGAQMTDLRAKRESLVQEMVKLLDKVP